MFPEINNFVILKPMAVVCVHFVTFTIALLDTVNFNNTFENMKTNTCTLVQQR